MPKDIPNIPETHLDWQPPKVAKTKEYEIELVTPMVGGGATAGIGDTEFPIRPTAIRGHLRHWWRLVRGHSLGNGMWRREEEIFGSTDFPSPLTVSVKNLTKTQQFDPTDKQKEDRLNPVAYALFASIENNQLVTKEGLRFQLTIQVANDIDLLRRRKAQNERRAITRQATLDSSIKPIDDDIALAIEAWVLFGGIGGRTRRGCGSIHCKAFEYENPNFPAKVFVGPAQSSSNEAWKRTLEVYREFRQNPRGGIHQKIKLTRNGPTTIRVPGRSHWPEADSIRQITNCSLRPPGYSPDSGVRADENTHDHSTPVVDVNLLPSFPKAVLGLPINFHFADGPNKGNAAANLDPKDVQLYPMLPMENGAVTKAERMASPVITRPIWMKGRWHPGIIILNQVLPEKMRVQIEGRNASLQGDLVRDFPLSRVIQPSLGAIRPMRGKPNAIEAFIDFLNSKDFTEVNR